MNDEERAKIFYLETRQRADTPDIEARIIWAHSAGLRAGREAERERCAKIAETGAIDRCYREETDNGVCGVEIAAAIRGGGG